MNIKSINAIIGITAFSAYGTAAQAHTFGAEGAGFAEGFIHPFIGVDHLLAMLAIGIWAVQLGHKALWRLPVAFVGTMSLSALLASYGLNLPLLEFAIAATVLLLGVFLMFSVRLPVVTSMLIAGLFASVHGYAHGLEMPQAGSPLFYGAGFIVATSLVHAFGITMAVLIKRRLWLTRAGGLAIAAAGLYLTTITI
ncbi:HupE/UreJ family protein [Methylotuvimicrobium alcaliphilum]|uniref:Nickel-iron hydrogenase, accessory protein n=1 Tax=Methylotuvimicrobium alcaliphilum (strain DSM 19304 / NCIMB 14124 / VKM B-2133 / 20Z) TaxID=1091494 RepID=G4T2Z6_META2|nr:HupE/UreJ family protein [Methylotuvimicrobium alcaliphilum]CCE23649.1 nickel-iron hydrogenase, accessory protein [Methylotuvimicrobium alcaliphilum 20Z]